MRPPGPVEEQSRRELYRGSSWHSGIGHPPRPMCDELVNLYLSSFEKVFRVFHVPSFQDQYRRYWESPQSSASGVFSRTLPVVMAIGASIHPDFKGLQSSLRLYALKCVLDAQKWIGSILEEADVSLAMLQTYCLLLIAARLVPWAQIPSGSRPMLWFVLRCVLDSTIRSN